MNIAFVITTLIGGGAEKVASILCNEWSKNNNVHLILTSNDIAGKKELYTLSKKVRITKIQNNKKVSVFKKILIIRKIFKREKIDACITFFPNSSFLSQCAAVGLKTVSIVSERNDPKLQKQCFFIRILKKITFAFAGNIVFQTDKVKSYFPKSIQRKGVVIYNPVLEMPKYAIKKSESKFKLISAGRLCGQKNYSLLINSIQILKFDMGIDVELNIFGDGPDQQKLEKLILQKKLEKCVHLHKFAMNIHEEILTNDLFILSSKYEGFPNVLLESATIGIPCISTDFDSGAAQIIIKDRFNGLLVPCDCEPKYLAEQINFICEHLSEFKQNASLHRTFLNDNFNVKSVSEKWLILIEEAIK